MGTIMLLFITFAAGTLWTLAGIKEGGDRFAGRCKNFVNGFFE